MYFPDVDMRTQGEPKAPRRKRMCGRPLMLITRITSKPMGTHGGHVKVLHLECGHTVMRTGDTRLAVGRTTGCPVCP